MSTRHQVLSSPLISSRRCSFRTPFSLPAAIGSASSNLASGLSASLFRSCASPWDGIGGYFGLALGQAA